MDYVNDDIENPCEDTYVWSTEYRDIPEFLRCNPPRKFPVIVDILEGYSSIDDLHTISPDIVLIHKIITQRRVTLLGPNEVVFTLPMEVADSLHVVMNGKADFRSISEIIQNQPRWNSDPKQNYCLRFDHSQYTAFCEGKKIILKFSKMGDLKVMNVYNEIFLVANTIRLKRGKILENSFLVPGYLPLSVKVASGMKKVSDFQYKILLGHYEEGIQNKEQIQYLQPTNEIVVLNSSISGNYYSSIDVLNESPDEVSLPLKPKGNSKFRRLMRTLSMPMKITKEGWKNRMKSRRKSTSAVPERKLPLLPDREHRSNLQMLYDENFAAPCKGDFYDTGGQSITIKKISDRTWVCNYDESIEGDKHFEPYANRKDNVGLLQSISDDDGDYEDVVFIPGSSADQSKTLSISTPNLFHSSNKLTNILPFRMFTSDKNKKQAISKSTVSLNEDERRAPAPLPKAKRNSFLKIKRQSKTVNKYKPPPDKKNVIQEYVGGSDSSTLSDDYENPYPTEVKGRRINSISVKDQSDNDKPVPYCERVDKSDDISNSSAEDYEYPDPVEVKNISILSEDYEDPDQPEVENISISSEDYEYPDQPEAKSKSIPTGPDKLPTSTECKNTKKSPDKPAEPYENTKIASDTTYEQVEIITKPSRFSKVKIENKEVKQITGVKMRSTSGLKVGKSDVHKKPKTKHTDPVKENNELKSRFSKLSPVTKPSPTDRIKQPVESRENNNETNAESHKFTTTSIKSLPTYENTDLANGNHKDKGKSDENQVTVVKSRNMRSSRVGKPDVSKKPNRKFKDPVNETNELEARFKKLSPVIKQLPTNGLKQSVEAIENSNNKKSVGGKDEITGVKLRNQSSSEVKKPVLPKKPKSRCIDPIKENNEAKPRMNKGPPVTKHSPTEKIRHSVESSENNKNERNVTDDDVSTRTMDDLCESLPNHFEEWTQFHIQFLLKTLNLGRLRKCFAQVDGSTLQELVPAVMTEKYGMKQEEIQQIQTFMQYFWIKHQNNQ